MKKPARAAILFRENRYYREELFRAGLGRLGYSVSRQAAQIPEPRDVLVVWNRQRHQEGIIRNYERRGATVLVVENGYIGPFFAMARNHHNGAGTWSVGGPERWDGMGIELRPWRSGGEFILVLAQRGIGEPGVAMPRTWLKRIVSRVSKMTRRPVRLRRHPGNSKADVSDALKGAWAVVTWGSGAAIKALAAGYPVFHELGPWIGAPASLPLAGADLERPFLGDRLPMFERLAWSQWRPEEVESGEAFRWLLG